MGISKYNAERYYDPIAYEGLTKVLESDKQFRINYQTGYMEINLDCFFPCTVREARKVFGIIHKYSSEIEIERLSAFLKDKEKYCYRRMKLYAEKAVELPTSSREYREMMGKFKEARTIHQRMKRNIEIFQEGRE